MKAIFSLILSITFLFSMSAQSIDSLENLLNGDLDKSTKGEILIELCQEYRNTNPNAMRLYAEELITLSGKDTLSNNYAWGQYYLGNYYFLVDDRSTSEPYFLTANEIFSRTSLLIVDEAHHLHWSETDSSLEYDLGDFLAHFSFTYP